MYNYNKRQLYAACQILTLLTDPCKGEEKNIIVFLLTSKEKVDVILIQEKDHQQTRKEILKIKIINLNIIHNEYYKRCNEIQHKQIPWMENFPKSLETENQVEAFRGECNPFRSCGVSGIVGCLGELKGILSIFGPLFITMFLCGRRYRRSFATNRQVLSLIVGVPSYRGSSLFVAFSF